MFFPQWAQVLHVCSFECAFSKSRVAPMRDLQHPAISIKHLIAALVSAELSGTYAKEMCSDPPQRSCSDSAAENMPFGCDFRHISLFFIT